MYISQTSLTSRSHLKALYSDTPNNMSGKPDKEFERNNYLLMKQFPTSVFRTDLNFSSDDAFF